MIMHHQCHQQIHYQQQHQIHDVYSIIMIVKQHLLNIKLMEDVDEKRSNVKIKDMHCVKEFITCNDSLCKENKEQTKKSMTQKHTSALHQSGNSRSQEEHQTS